MKVELGSGERPTPGYLHTDITARPGVTLDYGGPAWAVPLPSGSVDEVLALGVIEHLTRTEARDTFLNVRRMLKPGGVFLFDVPDLTVWCKYLCDYEAGVSVPFTRDHIMATLYGWQRWPGDEHKSGWTGHTVSTSLAAAGFDDVRYGLDAFRERGLERRRFNRPADAHIYVRAA